VTVCIPTHNRREELSRVLDALLAQTNQDFDIVICDDASTDGTTEWLRSLDLRRATLLRNERNLHYAATMRRLFENAGGEYVAVLHDHDGVEAVWLERMVGLMKRHPSAGMGCCACRLAFPDSGIADNGSPGLFHLFGDATVLPGKRLVDTLATCVHTPLAVAGSIFRRDAVLAAGGYRGDWYLAADEDLYARIAARFDVAFCPERLLTLTARSAAGTRSLGGWRSIYTLYEFRRDTALRYSGGMLGRWRALRLDARKFIVLVEECVSLWLRGEPDRLADALRPEVIPGLPSGRPTIGPAAKVLLAMLISVLRRTPAMARRAGHMRHRQRSLARGRQQ
jgi:glycosyltransferase involved in cell wall biosynthesis